MEPKEILLKSRVERDLLQKRGILIRSAEGLALEVISPIRKKYPFGSYQFYLNAFIATERLWHKICAWFNSAKYAYAFRAMHEYIKIVLDNKLHRLRQHDDFFQHSAIVVARLTVIETNIGIAYDGLKKQITIQQKEKLKAEYPDPAGDGSKASVKNDPIENELPPEDDINVEGDNEMKMEVKDLLVESSFAEDVLNGDQWQQHKIYGDGHCAFRAIGIALFSQGVKSFGEDEERSYKLLRNKTAELLSQYRNVMQPVGLTLELLITLDGKFDDYEMYLSGMRKSEYAGEIELKLLADCLPAIISIYKVEKKKQYRLMAKYGDETKQNRLPVVRLLWTQGTREAGNHYDLLQPVII